MARSLGLGARAGVVLALAGGLAAAGLAAGYAGLALCTPGPLPGDEGWHRTYLAGRTLALAAGRVAPDCPLGGSGGPALLQAVAPLLRMALALTLLAALWELAGWRLRLALLRRRGGHAVLAGPSRVTGGLAPAGMARLWLVPGAEAPSLRRPGRLWRHALPLEEATGPEETTPDPGLGKAALVVAAGPDDLGNLRLARRALERGFAGRLILQIDSRALRSLGTEALRAAAEGQGARLTIVAPRLVQARKALALAMPGRYHDDRPEGGDAAATLAHYVLCGDGPQLDDLMQRIARQAYGLEEARPRLSILRVEGAEVAASPAPDWAEELIDLTERRVPPDDSARIDTEMARIASLPGRLAAIFCLSAAPGIAPLLARRWDRVLADLSLPVPPIVALDNATAATARATAATARAGDPDPSGGGGSARIVPLPDLSGVEAEEAALDARAQAVHRHYLALVGAGDGATPPAGATLPARRPWADLPERYRDDNRAAADHMAYKMARLGLALRALPPDPSAARAKAPDPGLTGPEIETLARIEHARWVAARRVAGWTLGPRNDAAMTHPDLLPFEALDEAGRNKDRDQVARLPEVAALGGEAMLREWRLRADAGGQPPAAAARATIEALDALARQAPGRVPLLCGTADPDMAGLLAAAQAAGHLTELVLPAGPDPAHPDTAPLSLRHGAHRIRVAPDPRAALPGTTPRMALAALVAPASPADPSPPTGGTSHAQAD